jgi:Effector Associated Constant Component 1
LAAAGIPRAYGESEGVLKGALNGEIALFSNRVPSEKENAMAEERFEICIQAEDDRAAQEATRSLTDHLREITGVLAVDRRKADESTQDLGTIVEVIAASGATLALAQGIAEWLRRTRGTKLRVTSGRIKAEVENITPEVAERIIEDIIRKK